VLELRWADELNVGPSFYQPVFDPELIRLPIPALTRLWPGLNHTLRSGKVTGALPLDRWGLSPASASRQQARELQSELRQRQRPGPPNFTSAMRLTAFVHGVLLLAISRLMPFDAGVGASLYPPFSNQHPSGLQLPGLQNAIRQADPEFNRACHRCIPAPWYGTTPVMCRPWAELAATE